MNYCTNNDGRTHINVYSKGHTILGRWLSNFFHTPIITEDGPFESIEGYWYWLGCGHDKLRNLYGFKAKQYGRSVEAPDWIDTDEFKRKIKSAINIKIYSDKIMLERFIDSTLPFTHYYVYADKIVEPDKGQWVIDHITNLRSQLQNDLLHK